MKFARWFAVFQCVLLSWLVGILVAQPSPVDAGAATLAVALFVLNLAGIHRGPG